LVSSGRREGTLHDLATLSGGSREKVVKNEQIRTLL
jgi:hypothetical protein